MGDCKTLTATYPTPHYSFTGVSNSFCSRPSIAINGNQRARFYTNETRRTQQWISIKNYLSKKKAPL